MSVQEMIVQAQDAMTVKRVFGEPYEKDGVTIIPAAAVGGGGGGGGGEDAQGSKGSGGGYGLRARPVGAYVIREGNVRWQPALDLNRVILGGQVIAVVALLAMRAIARALIKRQRSG